MRTVVFVRVASVVENQTNQTINKVRQVILALGIHSYNTNFFANRGRESFINVSRQGKRQVSDRFKSTERATIANNPDE
jgi:hypothetical protein